MSPWIHYYWQMCIWVRLSNCRQNIWNKTIQRDSIAIGIATCIQSALQSPLHFSSASRSSPRTNGGCQSKLATAACLTHACLHTSSRDAGDWDSVMATGSVAFLRGPGIYKWTKLSTSKLITLFMLADMRGCAAVWAGI